MLEFGKCNLSVVVVRDESPYYCLRFLVEDCVFFPLRHSLFSEVSKVDGHEESDEGLKAFKIAT